MLYFEMIFGMFNPEEKIKLNDTKQNGVVLKVTIMEKISENVVA